VSCGWVSLKQRPQHRILSVLQALSVRALGGRLQAGLEAFNRQTAESYATNQLTRIIYYFVLQALAVRALGGRLQAGLEAFNRHAAESDATNQLTRIIYYFVLQALAVRALGGRLQAGLEAFNRHAAEEMDGLLEVQRKLVGRDRELQALVSLVSAMFIIYISIYA
jgi:fructose-1,6-bisphosphatase/sedoheptulose 1,7-bisphosphatase-like protein